ncbi:MAG: LapA family protein [Calditrichaeota bacterium]|nr:LapA family protein [Calditrichota bacterium]
MWIVRWIFWVLALLFLILFATQNATQTVTVEFVKWRSLPIPLWIVMYLSFLAGILVWFAGSIFKIVQLKSEFKKSQRENKMLHKELDELRNIPIEDDSDQEDDLNKELLA